MRPCKWCRDTTHVASACRQNPKNLSYYGSPFSTSWMQSLYASLEPTVPPASGPPLADVVAKQIAALTAGLDFVGGEEMPRPPTDLTTYADAFASALANCEHPNTTNLLYQREWQCDDCGRYLDKAAYKKSSAGRGFGWMFGG